jgi:hypothetical protein
MSLEQTIKDTVMAESVDLDMRLQQLVRAGLMPSNTIPLLRKAITKIQGGYPLQGAERDVMANFLNSMMFIVLGDDSIFNKARVGAKTYATEAKEKTEYDYEGDMAMGQLKSIIANSQRMHDMLSDDTNIPEWVQSKITLAEDYISTASNYMQGEMNEEVEELDELSTEKLLAYRKKAREADTNKHHVYADEADKKIKKKTGVYNPGLLQRAKAKLRNEEKMPFEGPYRKAGERKDKYGNPIKNVAQHLAKKAMKAGANLKMDPDTGTPDHFTAAMRRKKGLPEDVELEEKRGLWDNIHAKRKRIKAGSGERMRKPGSEGAPSAADLKNSRTEEVDLEEATYFVHTANNAHHVNEKIPTGKKDAMGQALMTSKVVKSFPYGDSQSKQTSSDQHKAAYAHAKKMNAGMKEEVETIDELSKGKLQSYMDKAKTKPGEVVANVNDPASMKKYGNRLTGRIRAGRKLLAKESRRGEALADIAAITQMNESYKTTFDAALTQYGIKSPSELDEEKRKQFFNFVDQEYKKGDN